jgi:hypothetical protein
MKGAGPVESLDDALRFRYAGCTRIASEHSTVILDAWKTRLAEESAQTPVIS